MNVADRGNGWQSVEQLYTTYKPFLFSLAYRMLGSVSDAEDAVQEVFATIREECFQNVSNPKAYLGKMVTNRCLNILKSASKRKETYVGPWLPEPWVQTADSPLEVVERRDEISYAFLLMLEKLTPLERAVLVLREALDYEYWEIAGMLEKTEAACRKIVSRAKKKLGAQAERPYPHHPNGEEELVQKWVSALASGNVDAIIGLIKEDAVLVTDGGGKVRAALKPIIGRPRVLALLKTLATRKFSDTHLFVTTVNGAYGIVAAKDDLVIGVVCFDWNVDGRAERIYAVLNPDKLNLISVGRNRS